ncbi:MAG: hypothetical protein CMJ41_07885 [Phycisphaerae bacterium]|nr:hypothetical protein [Phycisphaerae bacterium]|tara:strand:+ start:741 stop:965 length:225 start_codon:yes stop_codon:yes gene_type:complete
MTIIPYSQNEWSFFPARRLHRRMVKMFREGMPYGTGTTREDEGSTVMHLQALMELTSHRRKLAILTVLTFIVLC